MLDIYTDGASRGNPGEAGIGMAFYKEGVYLEGVSKYLGVKTNNEAEYTAVIHALKRALETGEKKIRLYSDSELLIKQLNGEYKVKSEKIIPLYQKVTNLLTSLKVEFHWVEREKNKEADMLANKAIDEGDSE